MIIILICILVARSDHPDDIILFKTPTGIGGNGNVRIVAPGAEIV